MQGRFGVITTTWLTATAEGYASSGRHCSRASPRPRGKRSASNRRKALFALQFNRDGRDRSLYANRARLVRYRVRASPTPKSRPLAVRLSWKNTLPLLGSDCSMSRPAIARGLTTAADRPPRSAVDRTEPPPQARRSAPSLRSRRTKRCRCRPAPLFAFAHTARAHRSPDEPLAHARHHRLMRRAWAASPEPARSADRRVGVSHSSPAPLFDPQRFMGCIGCDRAKFARPRRTRRDLVDSERRFGGATASTGGPPPVRRPRRSRPAPSAEPGAGQDNDVADARSHLRCTNRDRALARLGTK